MDYSVIIPAYQCEKTIKNTVKSILNAGLINYEIIIVDDGSHDKTAEICQDLLQKYKQLRYVYQENRGVSSARNKGLDLAKGNYVWFVDSDDSVAKGALGNVVKIIENEKPDMFIMGMSFDYYYKKKLYKRDEIFYPQEVIYSKQELLVHFDELYKYNAFTSSCNKMIRRELVNNYNVRYLENVFLMEDFLFSLDVLGYCEKVYLFPKVIYRYRQAEDEGNVYRRISYISNLSDFIKPFEERLKKHPVVLNQVYYMLLRQKLWNANLLEIKEISEKHKLSRFSPESESDKKLCNDLEQGHYVKIFVMNKKSQLRHRIANSVKRSQIYQILKNITINL